MSTLIFIAALLTLAIGASVLWLNARRFTNQIFALASLTSAAWLICFAFALRSGESVPMLNPVPWLRAASAAGAFFPWIIWLFMQSILTAEGQSGTALRRSWPWSRG